MGQSELLKSIQAHIARAGITASAVRGKGNAGVQEASHRYLRALDLYRLTRARPEAFPKLLDEITDQLRSSFPKDARHWGIARKVINLFLRDAVYSRHLCDHYAIEGLEPLLELPLDKYTMEELSECDRDLPRATPVKRITPDLSHRFQTVAAKEATSKKIARVHLDALWWGDRD